MKISLGWERVWGGCLIVVGWATLASAQPPNEARGPVVDRLREALDADGDRVISAAEINNASVALKSLDKDGDGQLSGEEMRPSFGRPPGSEDRH